jgi:Domain of Unknown Function (DUF928)
MMKTLLLKSVWTIGTIAALLLSVITSVIAAPRLIYRPPNNGAPGTNGSGASRPSCPTMAKPVVVLASTVSNWGETVDARPTLWFYQPYPAESITLNLLDEETQSIVWQQTYNSQANAGITKLELANAAPELAIGKPYRWQLEFTCNRRTQQAYTVDGIIVRRALSDDLKCVMTHGTPEERANLFAEKGLWFNAVHELANLKRIKPDDAIVQENWQTLLTHPEVKLDAWANETLINQ